MMRVFIRYGRRDVDLGVMPVVPLPDDRIGLRPQNPDAEMVYLTVDRRIFELRPAPPTLDHELLHITPPLEWVCVLTNQEGD